MHCSWLAKHLTWTHVHMKTYKNVQRLSLTNIFKTHFYSFYFKERLRNPISDRDSSLNRLEIMSVTLADGVLLCAFLCYPRGHAMPIILISGSVSSIRKPAFSPSHTRWTHRWTQQRSIGPLAQSAARKTCFSLSSLSVQIPECVFNVPGHDKFIVISQKTIRRNGRRKTPSKTATNGCYFVVRALLQILVSVVNMWSMSGPTGLGDSISHSSSCLE